MATLKVFRTPAGFHDAYVAAPSRKAALAAWGSKADLFARGVAEVVTDPALTEEPLAHPGEVIKRARTAADAAPEPPKRAQKKPKPAHQDAARPTPAPTSTPVPKPKPRPSRDRLDAAEQALADTQKRYAAERAALDREQAALNARRRAILATQEKEAGRLDAAQERARSAYDRALSTWRN